MFWISGVKYSAPLRLMFCLNIDVADSKVQMMSVFGVISVGQNLAGCWNNVPCELHCGLNMRCFAEPHVFECLVLLAVLSREGGAWMEEVGQGNGSRFCIVWPHFLFTVCFLVADTMWPVTYITSWCHVVPNRMNYSFLNSKTKIKTHKKKQKTFLKLLLVSYLVIMIEKINKKAINI